MEEYGFWEEALSAILPTHKSLQLLDLGPDALPSKFDFDDESFDAIIYRKVSSCPDDIKRALPEFKRLLKKEGHIIIFGTDDIMAGHLQAQGFSHCRERNFESLHCLSARKPSRDEQESAPQIALYSRYIQLAKKQIQLYQNWCQIIGMPYSEYMILSMLSRHSKGVRPSDISAALVIPPQTLTRLLAALQREGLIDRKTNARDHRSSVITLTEAGTDKIKPLQTELREIEERAFSGFSADELADLSGLSNKILLALDSEFSRIFFRTIDSR